jgi:hypothetical protein
LERGRKRIRGRGEEENYSISGEDGNNDRKWKELDNSLQREKAPYKRGPLSLVSTTEELLDRKIAVPV